MAASLITLSTLPSSTPRLLLLRRTSGSFPLSTTTSLSSFQTLKPTSEITHHQRRLPQRDRTVARAGGPPSASTLILVFLLPLSLLIGTILVSIRVGNNLDEKFMEEFAVNQAMIEEEEEEAGEEGQEGLEEVGAATIRIRNRPKREI